MNYNATENSKPKLLIVDDERDNIRILFGSLREDYDIVAADSGTLALEKALAERPDVILLDIVMPDMDGYEVIVRLKETGETADIPVIFITGLISPQDESKGFALGAADYIAKPFNIDVVRARVKTQLQIAGTIHSGVIARQIAETELQNAHALINSAPQYISYTDANGRYVFINPATYEVTGYSHDELMAGGIPELFEVACDILTREISNDEFYQDYGQTYRESLISKLIEGSITDRRIYVAHVADLYDGLGDTLYLAVADISLCDSEHIRPTHLRDLFFRIDHTCKYFIYSKYIVIIFSTDKEVLNVKKDLIDLYTFFSENNISTGISSGFDNLYDLKRYYNEAVSALNFGVQTNGNQRLFLYNGIR